MTKLDLILGNSFEPKQKSIQKEISRRLVSSQQGLCPVDTVAAYINLCLSQSCGKCVPCRTGLKKLGEIYDRILNGKGNESDIALIENTASVIADSADCVIGSRAGEIALESIKAFRSDYESHIRRSWCSASDEHSVPCVDICPAHVDIPGYISLVAAGRYADAVRLIRKDNPFPSVCGLICEHPCENTCRRNMVDDAINIRGLKRFAAEKAGYVPAEKVSAPTGKKVAVIGGGPAGLTAAYYLSLMGHSVDIFEKRTHLGGMLRYGIPDYRLPEKTLSDEIGVILETGINVNLNTDIGKDITIDKLASDYDATFISIGAHSDKKLRIPGEDLKNVIPAVKLLRDIGDGNRPDFKGMKVAVIGGGNVAMDAARSSVRLGAEKVSIVYRRRIEDMTALPDEIVGAIAEGCEPLTMMAPVRIEGNAEGAVKSLVVQPQIIGQVGRDGRPGVSAADTPEFELDFDIIIVAIGQAIESKLFGEFGLPLNRDAIAASSECDFEEKEGIFCGGDCATGPATVIKAIAAGKTAARNIDIYLGFSHEISTNIEMPAPSLFDRKGCGRVTMKERPADERKNDFSLMELVMSDEEAASESSRCLGCDHFGYGAFRGGRCVKW